MKSKLIIVISLIISVWGCEKDEGIGGTSEIVGKLYVKDYDFSLTEITTEYYAPDEDVFIIYGNDEVYSDKFKTHYDGTYRFKYLQKGNYTIFAYSKDTTENSNSGLIPVMIEIEITEKNQRLELEDLIIIK